MSLVMSRAELRAIAEKAGPDSPIHALVGKGRAPRDLEHPEQVRLFAWRAQYETLIPELETMYAIPNFSGRGKSKAVRLRDGARLKAEGRRKGMLDTCLPTPGSGYHALYLELKAEGYPSIDQKWWIAKLRAQGNRAEMVRGAAEARALILRYLELPLTLAPFTDR